MNYSTTSENQRMAKVKKSICKWKKEKFKERFSELKKSMKSPKFICSKCGRAAVEKGYLCKPEEL